MINFILSLFILLSLPFLSGDDTSSMLYRFCDRVYKVETNETGSWIIRDLEDAIIGTPLDSPVPQTNYHPKPPFTQIDGNEVGFYDYSFTEGMWTASEYLFPTLDYETLSRLVAPCFSKEEKACLSENKAHLEMELLVDNDGKVIQIRQTLAADAAVCLYSPVPFFRLERMIKTHLTFDDHGMLRFAGVRWGKTRIWFDFYEGSLKAGGLKRKRG